KKMAREPGCRSTLPAGPGPPRRRSAERSLLQSSSQIKNLLFICLTPIVSKIFTPFPDVVVKFIIGRAALYKLLAGPILSHKGVESRRLQPCHTSQQGAVPSVVDVFV